LKAAHFYYDWILRRMQDRGEAHHYLDLDDYCRRFSDQAREAAQRAIAATATMDEKVK
jgi:sarcosine oxidase delta subunit